MPEKSKNDKIINEWGNLEGQYNAYNANKKAIEEYGIENFNKKCQTILKKYFIVALLKLQ